LLVDKEPSPAVKLQSEIDALERLSALDAEIKDLQDELSRERESLSKKRQSLQELEAKLERDRQSVEEMERMRNELMLELRQMSNQIERSREKLSRCRTEREANAAQREVEELRKLFRDREIEIERLNGLAEQARQGIETTTTERDGIASELGETEGATTTRLGDVESSATAKEVARKEIVAQVTPQLYRRYELVRKRRGSAIASTTDGTCSECHMRLPPMLYQQLRRGESFDQCPSCNRILYFKLEVAGADVVQTEEGPSTGP
jgi:predicted  nucleic acid-binding Zn-ribbon protein